MAEAISARAVSVELDRRAVLHAISLRVAYGELLAVLGPNGAGKSTLLRALSGLVRHTGEIALAGQPLTALTASERARLVSFVPHQSLLAAALSVREVVALGRYVHRPALAGPSDADREAVGDALRATDTLALAQRAFHGLSTGEQKRVLLARALATGARVLLLDEPTASLDIEHALRFFALLRSLVARGHAVMIVLHQLEHALTYADRALLLRGGKLHAAGPPAEVLTAEHVRAVYHVELVQNGAPAFRLPPEAP